MEEHKVEIQKVAPKDNSQEPTILEEEKVNNLTKNGELKAREILSQTWRLCFQLPNGKTIYTEVRIYI